MVPGAHSHPRVAVLIPAYEAAATVGRSVRSALAEPEAAEVVVIDDGSRDGTADAARACDDGTGRLQVVTQPNGGPAQAVNRAYDLSKAPFACVLDSDDFFLPGRLGSLFDHLGDDWDFAADRLLVAEEGQEDGPYTAWNMRFPPNGADLSFRHFVLGNLSDPRRPRTELGFLQPVFRRAFMDAHGLRHDETLRLGEDYLLYALALACGARFRLSEEYGYVAVMRSASLSHSHTAKDLEALLVADRQLAAHPKLTGADRRAMRTHIANTRRRWVYHRALEAKAEGDLTGAIATIAGDLDGLAYILQQTVRAKLHGWRAAADAGAAAGPGAVMAGFGPPIQ